MSDEANKNVEPPLVVKVDGLAHEATPPLVALVAARPRPGLIEAIVWCLIFLLTQLFTSGGVIVFCLVVFAIQQPDPAKFLTEQVNGMVDASSSDVPAENRGALPVQMGQAMAYGILGAQFISLGLCLLVLPWRIGKGWKQEIALRRPSVIQVLLICLILPGFMMLSGGIQELLQVVFGLSPPPMSKLMSDMFRSFPWFLTFLAVGFGPGLVEEIWCRGFLGRGLTARYGLVLGVTMTSILFGLMHGSLTYAIPTAIMGAYLHFVYLTSRSIWASILLHTLNNSLAVFATQSGKLEKLDAVPDELAPMIYLASFSLVLFGSIALWINRPHVARIDENVETPIKSDDWSFEYPELIPSPPDSATRLKSGRISPTALVFTVVSFACLMFLLFK
jgi:membrane protease YdiL (CAAX protease family)